MNDSTKCFIELERGLYEEITLKELKKRKGILDTYKRKKFIPIQRYTFRSFK